MKVLPLLDRQRGPNSGRQISADIRGAVILFTTPLALRTDIPAGSATLWNEESQSASDNQREFCVCVRVLQVNRTDRMCA